MINIYTNMLKNRKLKWWGYLSADGEFVTRRYFNNFLDVIEAQESDFVEFVIEPFEALSAENARLTVEMECMKHLMSLK